jgi:hypothetical protein
LFYPVWIGQGILIIQHLYRLYKLILPLLKLSLVCLDDTGVLLIDSQHPLSIQTG